MILDPSAGVRVTDCSCLPELCRGISITCHDNLFRRKLAKPGKIYLDPSAGVRVTDCSCLPELRRGISITCYNNYCRRKLAKPGKIYLDPSAGVRVTPLGLGHFEARMSEELRAEKSCFLQNSWSLSTSSPAQKQTSRRLY